MTELITALTLLHLTSFIIIKAQKRKKRLPTQSWTQPRTPKSLYSLVPVYVSVVRRTLILSWQALYRFANLVKNIGVDPLYRPLSNSVRSRW